MGGRGRYVGGVVALILTTLLWGSSFPAIKVVVEDVGEVTYTWLRGAVSLALLAPYIVYRLAIGGLSLRDVKGGIVAGVFYSLGLWLQGWGTGLTTASNSAFLTALHMLWVHAYVASTSGRYTARLALPLFAALMGVVLLTRPHASFNVGDVLVVASSFMWAAQVIVVDRYSRSDPLVFTAAQLAISTLFIIPDLADDGLDIPKPATMLLIVYLAAGPGVTAFALQVWGQRYVNPAAATIIYQLEPVFAAAFSRLLLDERLTASQSLGAALIIAAVLLSEKGKMGR
ncbi:MAG: DMT family transporter [Desulfurococcales archaeon]|nr:DMT family transporter [Desulfurococcales archaeon]